jgi:hypothetical protein
MAVPVLRVASNLLRNLISLSAFHMLQDKPNLDTTIEIYFKHCTEFMNLTNYMELNTTREATRC